MLPNFLIIGAMKAGTTSLYAYLQGHPQVFMPELKEVHFFSDEDNWNQGQAWYERHFQDAGESALAVGEASTTYSRFPHIAGVPARVAGMLPDARLIYLVRNPVDRMISDYLHRLSGNQEDASLETALLTKRKYADLSSYAMQIEQYLQYFPRLQMLILKSEDLRGQRVETLRSVCEFLGIDGSWLPPLLHKEFHQTAERRQPRRMAESLTRLGAVSAAKSLLPRFVRRWLRTALTTAGPSLPEGAVSPDLRRRLEDLVREDVLRLRRYMDKDFDAWGIT